MHKGAKRVLTDWQLPVLLAHESQTCIG